VKDVKIIMMVLMVPVDFALDPVLIKEYTLKRQKPKYQGEEL